MCFLFFVKNSFRSDHIYIFVLTFWLCKKRLDKKAAVNFKMYNAIDCTTNNHNIYNAQYLETKDNEILSVHRI